MEYAEQQKLIDRELHTKLLEVGREIETTEAHELEPVIIQGIIATFDAMGASNLHIQQMTTDLMPNGHHYDSPFRELRFTPQMNPQYKIYDWLGMMYDGRCVIGVSEDKLVFEITKLMVEHYIAMKHVGGWAWSYRGHIDLQVEMEKQSANGKHCEDCILSYDDWHDQSDEERIAEQKKMEDTFGSVIHID